MISYNNSYDKNLAFSELCIIKKKKIVLMPTYHKLLDQLKTVWH